MGGLRGNQASFGFAKQTVKGLPVSALTDRMPFSGGSIQPSRTIDNLSETDANRDQGVAFLQTYGVEGAPEVYARDTNMHHVLEAGLGTIGDAGSGPYTHTITPGNTLPYYTMYREIGGALFEYFRDCKVNELTISADAGQPLTAALNVMGRDATRLTASPTNTSEVQSLVTTGTPTGGTIRIGFNGVYTTIPYNETAVNIATALNGLSSVTGPGGSFTTGGGPLPTAVTITGATGFANRQLPQIEVDGSGLTGGTNPTATITTTTQGASTLPALANAAVYNFNEATVTLGGVVTALVSSMELTISNNVTVQQTDDARPYDVVEGLREVTLGFQLIFEDVQQYSLFHYGATNGTDQASGLPTTSANFAFSKGASNQIKFDLPSLAYTEFPVDPDPGGDPVTVDVSAVALRGASPVLTGTVINNVAT
jgi:hypothetical protein